MKRPRGVTVIAALMFLSAATVLILPGGVHFRGIGTIRGPWTLALSLFFLAVGDGLLKLRRWARATAILITITDLALRGIYLAIGVLQAQMRPALLAVYLLHLPLFGLILWYLLTTEVQLAFKRETKARESIG